MICFSNPTKLNVGEVVTLRVTWVWLYISCVIFAGRYVSTLNGAHNRLVSVNILFSFTNLPLFPKIRSFVHISSTLVDSFRNPQKTQCRPDIRLWESNKCNCISSTHYSQESMFCTNFHRPPNSNYFSSICESFYIICILYRPKSNTGRLTLGPAKPNVG